MCWFGGLSVKHRCMLDRVVNVCSKIVGERLTSVSALYECRVRQKARRVAADSGHVLAQFYEKLPSGRRYRIPRYRLARTKSSFVGRSIQIMNGRCSE